MGPEREQLHIAAVTPRPAPGPAVDGARISRSAPAAIGNRAFGRLPATVSGAAGAIGNRAFGARLARARLAREPSNSDAAGIRADGTVHRRVEEMIDARRGSGSALPSAVREGLEGGLGANLADVRVHTDGGAAGLARSVAARAFTVGSDIFFDQGAYAPDTSQGHDLIAHEAAHTLQQRGAPRSGPLVVTEPGDAFERDADSAAAVVARQRKP